MIPHALAKEKDEKKAVMYIARHPEWSLIEMEKAAEKWRQMMGLKKTPRKKDWGEKDRVLAIRIAKGDTGAIVTFVDRENWRSIDTFSKLQTRVNVNFRAKLAQGTPVTNTVDTALWNKFSGYTKGELYDYYVRMYEDPTRET